MNNAKTFKLIETGVYAALIIIAITFIRIPMPSAIANSFVHPGNALVILSVLLMGFKRGLIASCIGLFLFDALNGYIASVGFTLLENIIVLLVVAGVYRAWFKKQDHLSAIISLGIIGAITKILVIYFKFLIQQLLLGSSLDAAAAVALTGMPASLFTGLVTAILVPLLYFPMKSVFIKYHPIGE